LSILENAAWLCWLIPIVGSLFVIVVAKIHSRLTGWYAVSVSAISALFSLSLIPTVLEAHGEATTISVQWIIPLRLGTGVIIDPLSVFMASLASCIGTLIIFYSVSYMAEDDGQPRYFFLMLLFTGAMIGLVMADNFLLFYVFWEVVGFCSYALIGFWYKKPSAAAAGMKAFIVTRVGDIFLLLGILIIYIATGTFDYLKIRSMMEASLLFPVLMVSTFMFLGAMGKSAQVPLHVWLPDAMEGPTPVSALIHSATMVAAGVYLVARMQLVFASHPSWLIAVGYIGAVTALLSATMALVNSDIKRILAYSTISQLGLMIAALGIGTGFSWFASQFHLLNHAVFKSMLFLCAGAVMHATGNTDLKDMGGLRKAMPATFIVSLIGTFSLAGFPPFNGFWSKDLIIQSALITQNYGLLSLVACTSILTVTYSLRWLYLIFLGKPSHQAANMHLHEAPLTMLIPMVILAGLTCVSGFLEGVFEHYMMVRLPETTVVFQLLLVGFSILILGVGSLLFCAVYPMGRIGPEAFRIGAARGKIFQILSNYYYFDLIYYRIFVTGLLRAFSLFFEKLEVRGIDQFNYSLSNSAVLAYNYMKRVQTGKLSYNMLLLTLGFMVLLIVALWLL